MTINAMAYKSSVREGRPYGESVDAQIVCRLAICSLQPAMRRGVVDSSVVSVDRLRSREEVEPRVALLSVGVRG